METPWKLQPTRYQFYNWIGLSVVTEDGSLPLAVTLKGYMMVQPPHPRFDLGLFAMSLALSALACCAALVSSAFLPKFSIVSTCESSSALIMSVNSFIFFAWAPIPLSFASCSVPTGRGFRSVSLSQCHCMQQRLFFFRCSCVR